MDLRLLRKYKEWKEAGGKELNWDELANENLDEAIPIDRDPINKHKKDDQLARQNNSTNIAQSFSETDNPLMTQPNDTSSPMPAKNQTLNEKEVLLKHIGPSPYDPPPEGYKRVPNGWKIKKIEHQTKATSSKRFDELFLDKIKGPVNKKKDRFQRYDLRTKAISQPKHLTEFPRKKEEFETKNKKLKTTAKKANQNPKQKKSINTNVKVVTSSSESEHEMSSSIHTDSESENDSEKESIDGNSIEIEHILNHGMSDNNIQNILQKTWDNIFLPVKEQDMKEKWYAIIYMGKKVHHTFIARLQKRFIADSDGPVQPIECVCLKEKLGFSDTVFEEEANPRSEIIVISDVMIGPLKFGMAGRRKWNVPKLLEN